MGIKKGAAECGITLRGVKQTEHGSFLANHNYHAKTLKERKWVVSERSLHIPNSFQRDFFTFQTRISKERVFGCSLFSQAILIFSGVRFNRVRAKKKEEKKLCEIETEHY